MSIEKRAIKFVQEYLEKRFWKVENVERNRQHPGCDFIAIARKGKKPIKIEVKGCGRLYGIPDLYYKEVTKSPRRLVADFLYVVYFTGRKPRRRLCKIPREAIKSKFFTLKKSFRISGKFKNERMLGRFMDP